MMAAISGVRPDTPFWDKLQNDECKTLVKFYRRVDKIMRLETAREAIQAGKSALAKKSSNNGTKRKNGDRPSSLEKANKKSKAPNLRMPQPPPSKFTNYTDLVSLREDIFMVAE